MQFHKIYHGVTIEKEEGINLHLMFTFEHLLQSKQAATKECQTTARKNP